MIGTAIMEHGGHSEYDYVVCRGEMAIQDDYIICLADISTGGLGRMGQQEIFMATAISEAMGLPCNARVEVTFDAAGKVFVRTVRKLPDGTRLVVKSGGLLFVDQRDELAEVMRRDQLVLEEARRQNNAMPF